MKSSSHGEYEQALVRSHSRILRYFKRTMPHEAEDLASEVLVAAWQASKNFRGDASVDTLTFRISLRVLAHRRRQLLRASTFGRQLLDDSKVVAPDLEDDVAEDTDDEEDVAINIQAALGKLSPQLARIVELSYLEGKKQREIAELLGLAPGTVASRLRRAKHHLRVELSCLDASIRDRILNPR